MPTTKDREKRQSIIGPAHESLGINQGTSGNIGLRHGDGMLITPTSTPYEPMKPEHIVFMHLDGNHDPAQRPSSRVEVSPRHPQGPAGGRGDGPRSSHYSTMLAIMGLEDSAGALHGSRRRRRHSAARRMRPSAPRSFPEHAVRALEGRLAYLLAHHGMIAAGPSRRGDVARGRGGDAGAAISAACRSAPRRCCQGGDRKSRVRMAGYGHADSNSTAIALSSEVENADKILELHSLNRSSNALFRDEAASFIARR